MTKRPILISGIPRSGSTWLGNVLAQAPNTVYIHEPDNEKGNLNSLFFKQDLHRYPYLDRNDSSPLYHKLWSNVLTGDIHKMEGYLKTLQSPLSINPYYLEKEIGKKSGCIHKDFFVQTSESNKGNSVNVAGVPMFSDLNNNTIPIVKSVHNMLALDWLDSNFSARMIIIVRHPASIISSYLKLKMPDSIRNIFAQDNLIKDYLSPFTEYLAKADSYIAQMTMQIGAFYNVLERQLEYHPNWVLIKHEDLCENPELTFKELFEDLKLEWTNEVIDFIQDQNKEGQGFRINRVAKDQIFKYKNELSEETIQEIEKYYSIFKNNLYQEKF